MDTAFQLGNAMQKLLEIDIHQKIDNETFQGNKE